VGVRSGPARRLKIKRWQCFIPIRNDNGTSDRLSPFERDGDEWRGNGRSVQELFSVDRATA
jgi:hypothetical protein